MAYSGNREYSKALAGFERTLTLDPDFSPVLNQVALIFFRMGEPAKAVPYLERYAVLNPDDPKPRDSIAQMLLLTGRLDDAVAKYKEVLAAYPDFTLSRSSLAYVYALQEKYPEALGCYDEMIARAPAESVKATGMWLRAFLRYFLGQWDRALADFRDLKAAAEKGGDGYSLMATDWMLVFVHLDRQEFGEAERSLDAYFDLSTKRNPARPSIPGTIRAILRARLDIAHGRPEAAQETLKAAEALYADLDPVTRESFSFPWMSTVAEAELAAGRVEDAIAAGEKLVFRILPGMAISATADYNTPFLKDVLARAYWKKGDLDRAAAEYRKLLTIDPANHARFWMSPLYHYRLGRVLEEKGDRAGARAEYAKFLDGWKDADPSHPELADARRRLAARTGR
jgi:tetratricopeptide (TPR) repeat protein